MLMFKPGFHIIIRINRPNPPVVSKLVQAIRAIIWKCSKKVRDDRDSCDPLDRQIHPGDRDELKNFSSDVMETTSDDQDNPNCPRMPRIEPRNTCLFMKEIQKYESLYNKFSKGKLLGGKKVEKFFPLAQVENFHFLLRYFQIKVFQAKNCCRTHAFCLFVRKIWDDWDDRSDPLLSTLSLQLSQSHQSFQNFSRRLG